MLGADDQKDPILMEMRVAKSSDAQKARFGVDYTAESLRLNTPASSATHSKACMELDINIWFRPGAQLEHLEIATSHHLTKFCHPIKRHTTSVTSPISSQSLEISLLRIGKVAGKLV
jgi:hypothetical protein